MSDLEAILKGKTTIKDDPNTTTVVEDFSKKFAKEYIEFYKKYPLRHEKQEKRSLISFTKEKEIPISYLNRKNGKTSLEEEIVKLNPIFYRDKVIAEELKSGLVIDLLTACYPMLMNLTKDLYRNQVVDALNQIITEDGSVVNYDVATKTQLDNWNSNNQDLILYGSKRSNLVAGDHTASLANIDLVNDKMSGNTISIAKKMALNAYLTQFQDSFTIRDCYINFFVLLCDDSTFEVLRNDPIIKEEHSYSYYNGYEFFYDGVIIKNINKTHNFNNIAVSFLCGLDSLIFSLEQEPKLIIDENEKFGVAVELKQQIRKANFNGNQQNMVTIFTSI